MSNGSNGDERAEGSFERPFDAVSARRFQLVDNDGNVRAELYCAYRGSVLLDFLDYEGKVRTRIGWQPGKHPEIELGTGEFDEVFAPIVIDVRQPAFVFRDFAGEERATFYLDRESRPTAEFYDEDGEATGLRFRP